MGRLALDEGDGAGGVEAKLHHLDGELKEIIKTFVLLVLRCQWGAGGYTSLPGSLPSRRCRPRRICHESAWLDVE